MVGGRGIGGESGNDSLYYFKIAIRNNTRWV
jgi:hypothetical protein